MALADFPRHQLTFGPSPIHPVDRLSARRDMGHRTRGEPGGSGDVLVRPAHLDPEGDHRAGRRAGAVGQLQRQVRLDPHPPQGWQPLHFEVMIARAPGDVGAAGDRDARRPAGPGEGQEDRLQDERRRTRTAALLHHLAEARMKPLEPLRRHTLLLRS